MWFHPYTLPFLDVREHGVIVYFPPPHFVKFWSSDRHNFEVFITVKGIRYSVPKKFVVAALAVPTLSIANFLQNSFRFIIVRGIDWFFTHSE